MPKSKRNKVVHLTRTKSKGRAGKESLVDQVQGAIDEHKTLYVFQVSNMRTVHMKEVRAELGKTRGCFGKNKVVRIALGRTREEAYVENIEKVSNVLSGNVGLLFTNESPSKMKHSSETLRATTSRALALKLPAPSSCQRVKLNGRATACSSS